MTHLRNSFVFLVILIGSLTPNIMKAEELGMDKHNLAGSSQNPQEQSDKWSGFTPPPDDKFDWIQLVSGEWLKGELKAMYNYELEFDSDELDLLKLDWDDVRQLRSAGAKSLYIEPDDENQKPIAVIGKLHIVNEKVVVTTAEGIQSYRRLQIISIAEGSNNELDLWSGKISLGANLRSGNTELIDTNIISEVMRRTAESRYAASYVANFSRSKDVETSNNHRLATYYDVFYSRRFFWRTVIAEYYRDKFKNIENQLILGTALGYNLIRTSKTEWEILGGLGALYKGYVSVVAGQDIENVSPLFVAGTRYETDITSRIEYLFDFNFQIVDKDSGTYIHHLVTTLSTDLYRDFDLDISLVWDRIKDPQPKSDGTLPEKDDFQLIVGITYEL